MLIRACQPHALLLSSLLLCGAAAEAHASESPAEPTAYGVAAVTVGGDEAEIANDDPADLRTGHWTLSVGGSVATPTAELVPSLPELGSLSIGGGGRLRLGWGLNRHLSLDISGGYTYLRADPSCEPCRAALIDVGAGLSYHVSQGFAMDPWISYGVGYRRIELALSSEDRTFHGIDIARVALGGDYYPTPAIGVGPFLSADIGMRDDENTVFYGVFQAGLRLSFDPMRAGTKLQPTVASR